MTIKAKESAQIHKARKKIKKQLAAAEKRINSEALKEMRRIIQQQIARRKIERIDLKERQIALFDENKHPAKTESEFILQLLHRLKERPKKDRKLEGRIKTIHELSDK
jgi:hypothetical protein